MEKITLKNSLKQHSFVYSLIKKATEQVQAIENYQKLKNSKQLTQHVTKLVDSEFEKTYEEKVEKKAIVIEVLQNVFNDLTPDEITAIESDIDFIYDNTKKKRLSKTIIKFSKFSSKSNSKINTSKLISKYLYKTISTIPGYQTTQIFIQSQIQSSTIGVLLKCGLSKTIILSILLFI